MANIYISIFHFVTEEATRYVMC